VAVLGAGAIGRNHIESFLKHPAARVAALGETSPVRGREVADRFGIPYLYQDYRKILPRPAADVPLTLQFIRALAVCSQTGRGCGHCQSCAGCSAAAAKKAPS
jgi:predicted dehydrogenase